MVDRVKPWFLVHGLAHGSLIMDHGSGSVHMILVSAPVPLDLILTRFDWFGAGPWGFGF